MRRVIAAFKIGLKEMLVVPSEFVGEIAGNLVFYALVSLALSSIIPNHWRYLAATLLVLPPLDIFASIVEAFTKEVQHGWSKVFARPCNWFLFVCFRKLGNRLLVYLINALIGLFILHISGGFNPIGLIAIPLCLFFDLSVAYVVGALAYFLKETWGIRIYFFELPYLSFGGAFIGAPNLPVVFSGRFYLSALFLLGETGLPLFPFVLIPIFLIAGWLLHKKGQEVFEAWGG